MVVVVVLETARSQAAIRRRPWVSPPATRSGDTGPGATAAEEGRRPFASRAGRWSDRGVGDELARTGSAPTSGGTA